MTIQRVALVFDNQVRPETTGGYCLRALHSLVDVEHFLPADLDRVPRKGFDLYLNIDDGLRYSFPKDLHPCAWWAIDTHLNFDWCQTKAPGFDFLFAAQRDGAAQFGAVGTPATWLPLACDPEVHHKHELSKQWDISFVGNLFPGPRAELLELLQRRFRNCFIGQRFFEEMARTYSASRLVFNRSIRNDINMRVFEALACGSLLLTNDLTENGQEELFRDGTHLATYREPEELLDKAAFYLRHDPVRERLAAAGRAEAIAYHTYRCRLARLLREVERMLSPTSARSDAVVPPSSVTLPADNPRLVSACLISWRRPRNIPAIIAQLRTLPFIDDILIWDNNPESKLAVEIPNVRVIPSVQNVKTYGRYLCARQARHDVIYTQDDDCLIGNIAELYEAFRSDPTRIAHGLKAGHLRQNGANFHGSAQMALVGWGAFFKKEWVDVLRGYEGVYGQDDLLFREADRIFSLLLNRHHRSILGDVTDLPGVEGSEALSVEKDHLVHGERAVARALSLLQVQSSPSSVAGPLEPATESAAPHDLNYFDWPRPELLALIPSTVRKVLDIGCGSGRLGRRLRPARPSK